VTYDVNAIAAHMGQLAREDVAVKAVREFLDELMTRCGPHASLTVAVEEFPIWLMAMGVTQLTAFRNQYSAGTYAVADLDPPDWMPHGHEKFHLTVHTVAMASFPAPAEVPSENVYEW
jgi:hypothetical protein